MHGQVDAAIQEATIRDEVSQITRPDPHGNVVAFTAHGPGHGQAVNNLPVRAQVVPNPANSFHFYTIADILEFPDPEWLVKGLLEEKAFTVLFGPSGSGKSFVALDLALCVATGSAWHGLRVKQGKVIYVAAEGRRGIKKRIAAWMKEHGVSKISEALFILKPVQMLANAERDELVRLAKSTDVKPALVVFDTFARCFVGGEENDAGDMGKFVESVGTLREALGDPTVLLVHHTGKEKDRAAAKKTSKKLERGSSALRGAADTMLALERNARGMTLVTDKQKDDEEDQTGIALRLKQVPLGHNKDGDAITFCVVERLDIAATMSYLPVLSDGAKALLGVLKEHPEGLPVKVWKGQVAELLQHPVPSKTFDNWRKELMPHDVEATPGKRFHYQVTAATAK